LRLSLDQIKRPVGWRLDLGGAFATLPRDSHDDLSLIDALSYAFTEQVHAAKAFWPKILGMTSLIVSVGPRCVRTQIEATAFYARWMREACLVESEPHVMTLPGQRVQDVFPDSNTVLILQPLNTVIEGFLARCASRARMALAGEEEFIG
jgi:hypothetical protein